jgi:iron(III) transport system permease protein
VQMGWLGRWSVSQQGLSAALSGWASFLLTLPVWGLLGGLVWNSWQAAGRWPSHAGAALFNSLWLAVGASALSVGMSWAIAVWAVRLHLVRAANALLLLCMLWPSALTGLSIAGAAAPLNLPDHFALVTAHVLRVLPFTAWVLLALQDVRPAAPVEQLQVMGAPWWSALRHVHGPQAAPGLAAALLLGVGLSLSELTATVLTVPAGTETVILRLYNLLHYGDQRGVMSLALMQGLLLVGCLGVASWFWRQTREPQRAGQ